MPCCEHPNPDECPNHGLVARAARLENIPPVGSPRWRMAVEMLFSGQYDHLTGEQLRNLINRRYVEQQ